MGSRSCSRVVVSLLSLAAPLVVAEPAALADVDHGYIGIGAGAVTSSVAVDRVGAGGAVVVAVTASSVSDATVQVCIVVDSARRSCLETPLSPEQVDGSQLSRSDMQTVTDTTGTKTGYLHPHVAPYFQAMIDAYVNDPQTRGMSLSFWVTYRSYETQLKAYNNFVKTGRNLAGRKVPNIAHPDNSLHPKGYAVDFALTDQYLSSIQYQWLAANAARFGFRGIDFEPWHWEFDPTLLKLTSMGQPGISPPTHDRQHPRPLGPTSS